MKDPGQTHSLEKTLAKRVASLASLHQKGIVPGQLLGRQVLKLLASPEARKLHQLSFRPDAKAYTILYRLEHPGEWRRKTGLDKEKRLAEFLGDLEVILTSGSSSGEKLKHMLSLACLPFYQGFALPESPKEEKAVKSASRVSVLE